MMDITDADDGSHPKSWAEPLPEGFYCDNVLKFQYASWQKSPALKRRFAHIIEQDDDLDMVPPKKPKSRKDPLRYANCKLVSSPDEKDMRLCVEVEDETHLNFKMTMSKGASFGDIFARISLYFECDGICINVREHPSAYCCHIHDKRSVMIMARAVAGPPEAIFAEE